MSQVAVKQDVNCLTWEELDDKYKLVTNPFDSESSWEGCLFDYEGKELEFVLSIANTEPNRVWTYTDIGGDIQVDNGYSLVNRLGYFITEKAGRDNEYHFESWDD